MVKVRDFKGAARREMRRILRLGPDAFCWLCGLSALLLLRPVKNPIVRERVLSALFQMHHPLGRAHDPDWEFPTCLHCHVLATEDLLKAGVSMKAPRNLRENHDNRLKALAVLAHQLADALDRLADEREPEVETQPLRQRKSSK